MPNKFIPRAQSVNGTWLASALAAAAVSCSGTDNSEIYGLIDPGASAPDTVSDPAPPELPVPMPPASLLEGLAMTPPMGFNDWNAFGCDVSETLIKETADFFVSSGLKAAGYTYVNIDDCWALRERGADGKLVPDPVKFPSGIKGVADYVHGLGLKLGIYGDAGTMTCAGYPGSLGTEVLDAQTWAEWGVDYVKYDNCYNQSDGSREDYVNRYTAMREAIEATGRPMIYSICEWGQSQPWEWATGVGHLWRTTGDITDSWSSVQSIIASNVTLAPYAGPGHWNDPDMLEIGNGGMTPTEYRTHMSMWAMMAAPLIIGTDLRQADADTLRILSNPEVIAIDQDPLGKQATIVSDDGAGLMVLEKPLASGDMAIALYNATDELAIVRAPVSQTGLGAAAAYRLHDVWSNGTLQAASTIAAGVPAHGAVVYRVSPIEDAAALPPSVSVGGSLGTLISGVAEGATLTVTTENHGLGSARDVAVSVAAPDGWAVTAGSGSTGAVLDTDASLTATWTVQVPPGTAAGRYPISVTAAYTWGASSEQATTVSELGARVVVPPPDGMTLLSALTPVSSTNASGPVERDSSNGGQTEGDGNLITIGGQVYTRGLGTNANSRIVYYLGGRCSTLTTDVGIDDEVTTGGSASFTIYADDAVVAQSGLMGVDDPARTLNAVLTGATSLQLVTDAGDSTDGDHADWAAPKITCGGSTEPTATEQTLFSFEAGTEEWTLANPAVGGSMAQSTAFHTEGATGLQVVSPTDGNWFGRVLPAPLDLTGRTALAFDLATGAEGTSGEFAVQVGPGASWCQGGRWLWTNPSSSRTVRTAFSAIECPAGVTLDLTQIGAVWVFLKGGTFSIDHVRAE